MAYSASAGLIVGLTACRSWDEFDSFVGAHAAELDDRVDGRLALIAEHARQRGHGLAAADVEQRRDALRNGQPAAERVGLTDLTAYRHIALACDVLDAPSWESALNLAAAQAEVTHDDLDAALALVETNARMAGDDDTASSAGRHRVILRRAREVGVAIAVEEAAARPELREPKDLKAWLHVVARLAAVNSEEVASILDEYPTLLSEDADGLLRLVRGVVLERGELISALLVEDRRMMLRRVRRLGIAAARRALSAADATTRGNELIELSRQAMDRYGRLGDQRALDEAIGARLEALRVWEEERGDLPYLLLLNDLGGALTRRCSVTGDLADLQMAVGVHDLVLRSVPEEAPPEARATFMSNLSEALALWANATGDRSPIRLVVALSEQTVQLLDQPTAARAHALVALAGGLLALYDDDGELDRVERAIGLCHEVLSLPAAEPDTRLVSQVQLVTGLLYRYQRIGQDDGLDAAVREVLTAVRAAASDDPEVAGHAATLGTLLVRGFIATGRLSLADASVALLDLAVDRSASDAPPVSVLGDLASALLQRYEAAGDDLDLDRAVETSQRAASIVDRGSPQASPVLMGLGNARRRRYKRGFDPADLDRAVDALDEAAALAQGEDRLIVLANLGFALQDRYQAVRQLGDLDRSIAVLEEVVAHTPATDPNRLGRVGALAGALRLRALRLEDSDATTANRERADADLDRAVTLLEDAIRTTGPRHQGLAIAWSSLGLALWNRFSRGHDVRDIQRAGQLLRSTVEATPANSPFLEELLWNYLLVTRTRITQELVAAGRDPGPDSDRLTSEVHARLLRRCRQGDSRTALDELEATWSLAARQEVDAPYPSGPADPLQQEVPDGLLDSLLPLTQPGAQLPIDPPEALWSLFNHLREAQQRGDEVDDDTVRSNAATWRTLLAHPAVARIDEQGQRWLLLKGAAALFFAYNAEPSVSTLDPLIATYNRLLVLLPEDHSWHAVVLIDAARLRATRHSYTADAHDLDAAFDALAGFADRVETASQHWLTCLIYLGNLLEEYSDTAKHTESYARRVRLVDKLLGELPPAADDVRRIGVRLALIHGYFAVSEEPSQQLVALRRVAELADQVRAIAVRDGWAELAEGMGRLADDIRGQVSDLEVDTIQQVEVRLDDELRDAGDRSDPEAAAERIRRLRLLCRQVPFEGHQVAWFLVRGALVVDLQAASGERAANIDEAIGLAHEMLVAADRQDDPVQATMACVMLSELYLDRPRGNHADNTERALEYSRRLVDLAEPASSNWITGQTKVAFALIKRIHGDHRTNLEEALERCQQALAATDPDADPGAWASAQFMLGTAYSSRVAGARADNLERAIEAYVAALGALTLEEDGHRWANAHHNLATAYSNRLLGDREDNLRQAIEHYWQELRFFTRNEWPEDWALAQCGLGDALSQSRGPNPQQTMDAAVAAFEAALTVLTKADYPAEWPRTMNSLGLVLFDADNVGGRAHDPQRALECFQAALEAFGPDAAPHDRARVLMNMVGPLTMLADQHSDDRAKATEFLDTAMAYGSEAVDAFTADSRTLDRARAQTNLAQVALGYADVGLDQHQHLLSSAKALEDALEVFHGNGLLAETRNTAHGLAYVYAARTEWARAAAAYRTGADAAEALYQASMRRDSRDAALRRVRPLVEVGVTALVKAGDLDGALTAIERARARWLGEALARDRVDLARLTREHPQLAATYHEAATRVQSIEALEWRTGTLPSADPAATSGDADPAVAARAALADTISRIRRRVGYERFLALPDIDDVGAAVQPGEPLAYLVPTGGGCLQLLVYRPLPGAEVVIEAGWAEGLTTGHLDRLLLGDAADGSYLQQQITGAANFGQTLTRVLDILGRQLVGKLADRLRDLGASGVVLIQGGRLALLPLHAAAYVHDGRPTCLLDEFDVHHAPSAWVHAGVVAAATKRSAGPDVLAGIADPTGDLRYARAELEDVAALFGGEAPRVRYGGQATKAALLGDLRGVAYVHLACHGHYDLTDPLESHLRLAGDERLTLRELLDGQKFQGTRLVVASACQTALAEFVRLPDESVGLPAGFLRAGAGAVIGTLWPVDDLSTALLMVRFYELHLGSQATGSERAPMPAARALRLAQRWLAEVTAAELARYFAEHKSLRRQRSEAASARLPADLAAAGAIRFGFDRPDERPFSDPYYWAPFLLTGA